MISLLQDQTYMPSFDEFWNLYNYKKARKAASKAWFKLSFIEHNLIMAHLPERVTSDQQWLKGFQPHAATFLNGELWEDEYEKGGRHSQGSEPESIVNRLQRT